ncbi:MAG: rhomboid family intramembrane serine protease [Senegalia sp. (in: firmicutes)]
MVTPEGRKSILSLLGINLALTIFVPSISITAHIGGLVIGYLLSYVFIK